MRAEAAYEPGRYDLVHAHYWLSGQVGCGGEGALGRAAGAVHAHAGEGEERRAAPRATPPSRRCRIAARPRWSRPRTGWWPTRRPRRTQLVEPVRGGPVPGRDRRSRSRPRRCSGPDRSARPGTGSACRRTRWCSCSPAGCSRSRRRTCVLHAAARLIRDDPPLADRLVVAFVGGPSGAGRADPDQLARAGGRSGHLRPRPARAALPAGGAGRLVPRGDRRARAVLLGVVRPGRGRGAGLRHAGRGRGGRRAAHRGARRRVRRAGRRATIRPTTPARCGTWSRSPATAGQPVGRRDRARRPVQLDRRGRSSSWGYIPGP